MGSLLEIPGFGRRIAYDEHLDIFDQMAGQGIVSYDYDQLVQQHEVDGFHLEFRVTKALLNKPQTPTASLKPEDEHPNPIAGSDINAAGMVVQTLFSSHVLAFNKFSAYRPHYLILTLDGFKRQSSALDLDDFKAMTEFLHQRDDFVVFWNCGADAGCSRVHKHMQAIPKENFGGDIWRNVDKDSVPFALQQHDLSSPLDPEALLELYEKDLEYQRRLGESLNKGFREGEAPPHNLLLTKDNMVYIPRRAAGIDKIGVNACGMLGMVWTQSEDVMARWLEITPRKLLEAAGYPRASS